MGGEINGKYPKTEVRWTWTDDVKQILLIIYCILTIATSFKAKDARSFRHGFGGLRAQAAVEYDSGCRVFDNSCLLEHSWSFLNIYCCVECMVSRFET